MFPSISSSSSSLLLSHRPQHMEICNNDCEKKNACEQQSNNVLVENANTAVAITLCQLSTNQYKKRLLHRATRQHYNITKISLQCLVIIGLVLPLLLSTRMVSGFVATTQPLFVALINNKRFLKHSPLVLQTSKNVLSSSSSALSALSRGGLSVTRMPHSNNHLNSTTICSDAVATIATDDDDTDTDDNDMDADEINQVDQFFSYLSSLENSYIKSIADSATVTVDVDTVLSDTSSYQASTKTTTAQVVPADAEDTDIGTVIDSSTDRTELNVQLLKPSSTVAVTEEASTGFMGLSDVAFARGLLLCAAALYGTNFSLVKMLGNMDIPIGISATLRFGLAAIATSPWLFLSKNKKSIVDDDVSIARTSEDNGMVQTLENSVDVVKKQNFPQTGGKLQEFLESKNIWTYELGATLVGLEAGVWNSMAYITQAVGLTTTAASKSAFLCSLAVVIVPLLDRLVGKKLEMKQIVGVMMALGGVAVLELGGLSSDQLAFTSGDIASLVQPIAFGMAFWRMESACHNYPDEANRLTASQLLAVFTCSALFTSISDPSSFQLDTILHFLSNPMIVASLAWTGLVSTALTVYMETIALKSISAAETTLILSTEPLWGSFFAAVLMGETFGFDAAFGGLLILAGCLYSSLGYDGIKNSILKKMK